MHQKKVARRSFGGSTPEQLPSSGALWQPVKRYFYIFIEHIEHFLTKYAHRNRLPDDYNFVKNLCDGVLGCLIIRRIER